MLEPFVTIAFNSFLSGRTAAGHCPSINSIARAMVRPVRPTFPPDFFIPHPRRETGKGKGKVPRSRDHEYSLWNFLGCDESSCAMNHSSWCSRKPILLMCISSISHLIYLRTKSPTNDERSCSSSGSILSTTPKSPSPTFPPIFLTLERDIDHKGSPRPEATCII